MLKAAPALVRNPLAFLARAFNQPAAQRDASWSSSPLPKNSKIGTGKTWAKPDGATNVREFRVYRWNPDDGQNPRVDTFFVDTDDCGPMILDAIIWIKSKVDPTLTFRPLVPRGHLRLLRDEHRRHQHARLHQWA